jgi:hypothetical protein
MSTTTSQHSTRTIFARPARAAPSRIGSKKTSAGRSCWAASCRGLRRSTISTLRLPMDSNSPTTVVEVGCRGPHRAEGERNAFERQGYGDDVREVQRERGPSARTVSLHDLDNALMTVSLAAGGAGLGTAWGEGVAVGMLREAEFDDIKVEHVEGDVMNVYYIARKA